MEEKCRILHGDNEGLIMHYRDKLARERDEIEDMEVAHAKLSEMYCRELQRWVDALATIRKRESLLDRFSENNDNLNKLLARERESRKQAEAALRKAHEQTEQAAHNLCTCVNRSTWSCNACMSLLPIERTLSAALAVQEPAEPERGK